MKLLNITNRYSLIFLILLSPIMIAVDFFLINFFVNKEVNDILLHERKKMEYTLNQQNEIPASNYMFKIDSFPKETESAEQFRDTLFYEDYAGRYIPYRVYAFMTQKDNQPTKIYLRHAMLEMNELVWWLFAGTTFILLLLATGLYFINKKIAGLIWEPFFTNLSYIRNYDINAKNPVRLESSPISEFEAFNHVIINLMNRIKNDFRTLKEFNENISHEMQTPLAIIRNKMVLLLENENLGEKELNWVQAAYAEANKLSKIGKSLTLISRIENEEFKRLVAVDIKVVIENIITNMDEIIRFKQLEIKSDLHSTTVKCDPILANILFTNLIKNAVQHNYEGGYIRLVLQKGKFEIKNSGKALKKDSTQLFNRFQKENKSPDNLGLGLSISQRICELYGFNLDYVQHKEQHAFSLFFQNSSGK